MPKHAAGFFVADNVCLHAAQERRVLQDLHDVKHHGDRALHVGRSATDEFLPVVRNSWIVGASPPRNEIGNRDGVEVTVHDDGRSQPLDHRA